MISNLQDISCVIKFDLLDLQVYNSEWQRIWIVMGTNLLHFWLHLWNDGEEPMEGPIVRIEAKECVWKSPERE